MDQKLIPDGLTRCSFGRHLLWLACIAVFILWGAYAATSVFHNGLGVTGLNNNFGFGLWITFDLVLIALGAGAFFSGFLMYILQIKQLKSIMNLAVIVGFICYTGAMLILTMDIGQPLRAWFGYWHPNVHSMLTEVIFCITCYCMVLIIELIPDILKQKQLNKYPFLHNLARNMGSHMALFAAMGTFLSTFHQGSLGGMYGVLFGRPYAFREGFFIWPWTFFLFILSAVAAGPQFTVLICVFMEKLTGKKLVEFRIKVLMGKIGGTMLCLYLFFKFIDTWRWASGVLPELGFTFDQMFHQIIYGKWLMWTELIICGIVPAVMLMVPFLRNRPFFLYLAGVLTCTGVSINRYVFTVQTTAQPVMPFTEWQTYVPVWTEWAPTAMIIAYGFLVMTLCYRYLPVFPQERRLNS